MCTWHLVSCYLQGGMYLEYILTYKAKVMKTGLIILLSQQRCELLMLLIHLF